MVEKTKIIWWVVSVLLLLAGLFDFLSFFENSLLISDFIEGIFFLIAGLISLPLLTKKVEMKSSIRIIIVVLLVIISFYSTSQYEKMTNLQYENEVCSGNLEDIKGEIQSNIDLLTQYQEEIKTSMEWFNTNSILKDSITGITLPIYLTKCYDYSSKKCKIRLGCLFLVNSEFLELEYKFDPKTSNEEDKLQSLSEFTKNKGGDCEDYSLFYKAEYNYILQNCINKGINEFELEAYETSLSSSDKVWLDFDNTWYLIYANEKIIPSGYIYPNIVCGDIYDLNSGNISGHCMIAFTKKEINKIDDLQELNKAPLIEPQTGEFSGLINDDSSRVYLLEESGLVPNSYIYMVITNKDLFYFIEDDWVGYSTFKQKLENEEEKLLQYK